MAVWTSCAGASSAQARAASSAENAVAAHTCASWTRGLSRGIRRPGVCTGQSVLSAASNLLQTPSPLCMQHDVSSATRAYSTATLASNLYTLSVMSKAQARSGQRQYLRNNQCLGPACPNPCSRSKRQNAVWSKLEQDKDFVAFHTQMQTARRLLAVCLCQRMMRAVVRSEAKAGFMQS